jgi:hypothetical protein
MNTLMMGPPVREFFVQSLDVSGSKVKIKYVEVNNGYTSTSTLDSEEPGNPSLYEALNNLLPETIFIAGLDAELWAEAAIVSILLRSPDSKQDSAVKVTIRGQVIDRNPTQSLTTPFLAPDTMGEKVPQKLEAILHHVQRYVQGDRGQGDSLDAAA